MFFSNGNYRSRAATEYAGRYGGGVLSAASAGSGSSSSSSSPNARLVAASAMVPAGKPTIGPATTSHDQWSERRRGLGRYSPERQRNIDERNEAASKRYESDEAFLQRINRGGSSTSAAKKKTTTHDMTFQDGDHQAHPTRNLPGSTPYSQPSRATAEQKVRSLKDAAKRFRSPFWELKDKFSDFPTSASDLTVPHKNLLQQIVRVLYPRKFYYKSSFNLNVNVLYRRLKLQKKKLEDLHLLSGRTTGVSVVLPGHVDERGTDAGGGGKAQMQKTAEDEQLKKLAGQEKEMRKRINIAEERIAELRDQIREKEQHRFLNTASTKISDTELMLLKYSPVDTERLLRRFLTRILIQNLGSGGDSGPRGEAGGPGVGNVGASSTTTGTTSSTLRKLFSIYLRDHGEDQTRSDTDVQGTKDRRASTTDSETDGLLRSSSSGEEEKSVGDHKMGEITRAGTIDLRSGAFTFSDLLKLQFVLQDWKQRGTLRNIVTDLVEEADAPGKETETSEPAPAPAEPGPSLRIMDFFEPNELKALFLAVDLLVAYHKSKRKPFEIKVPNEIFGDATAKEREEELRRLVPFGKSSGALSSSSSSASSGRNFLANFCGRESKERRVLLDKEMDLIVLAVNDCPVGIDEENVARTAMKVAADDESTNAAALPFAKQLSPNAVVAPQLQPAASEDLEVEGPSNSKKRVTFEGDTKTADTTTVKAGARAPSKPKSPPFSLGSFAAAAAAAKQTRTRLAEQRKEETFLLIALEDFEQDIGDGAESSDADGILSESSSSEGSPEDSENEEFARVPHSSEEEEGEEQTHLSAGTRTARSRSTSSFHRNSAASAASLRSFLAATATRGIATRAVVTRGSNGRGSAGVGDERHHVHLHADTKLANRQRAMEGNSAAVDDHEHQFSPHSRRPHAHLHRRENSQNEHADAKTRRRSPNGTAVTSKPRPGTTTLSSSTGAQLELQAPHAADHSAFPEAGATAQMSHNDQEHREQHDPHLPLNQLLSNYLQKAGTSYKRKADRKVSIVELEHLTPIIVHGMKYFEKKSQNTERLLIQTLRELNFRREVEAEKNERQWLSPTAFGNKTRASAGTNPSVFSQNAARQGASGAAATAPTLFSTRYNNNSNVASSTTTPNANAFASRYTRQSERDSEELLMLREMARAVQEMRRDQQLEKLGTVVREEHNKKINVAREQTQGAVGTSDEDDLHDEEGHTTSRQQTFSDVVGDAETVNVARNFHPGNEEQRMRRLLDEMGTEFSIFPKKKVPDFFPMLPDPGRGKQIHSGQEPVVAEYASTRNGDPPPRHEQQHHKGHHLPRSTSTAGRAQHKKAELGRRPARSPGHSHRAHAPGGSSAHHQQTQAVHHHAPISDADQHFYNHHGPARHQEDAPQPTTAISHLPQHHHKRHLAGVAGEADAHGTKEAHEKPAVLWRSTVEYSTEEMMKRLKRDTRFAVKLPYERNLVSSTARSRARKPQKNAHAHHNDHVDDNYPALGLGHDIGKFEARSKASAALGRAETATLEHHKEKSTPPSPMQQDHRHEVEDGEKNHSGTPTDRSRFHHTLTAAEDRAGHRQVEHLRPGGKHHHSHVHARPHTKITRLNTDKKVVVSHESQHQDGDRGALSQQGTTNENQHSRDDREGVHDLHAAKPAAPVPKRTAAPLQFYLEEVEDHENDPILASEVVPKTDSKPSNRNLSIGAAMELLCGNSNRSTSKTSWSSDSCSRKSSKAKPQSEQSSSKDMNKNFVIPHSDLDVEQQSEACQEITDELLFATST
ncbi:unnamed protein product [Amoebophrya sp. A120]|nr:unnamed protein product [Amoebophrya sp. A120]|eukprot:GSA120T00009681001.1